MAACENVDSEKAPVISGPPSTAFPMPPPSGRSINEMGWELTDGRRQLFSQYHGNVLILDFYATWCLPCRESIPHLVSLQDRYRDKGLTIVGLNVGGPDDWPKVAAFAREMKIQYTLAVPDGELGSFLMADRQEIPQTFVFDRQGKLLKRLIGFSDSDVDLLEKIIQEATKKD